MCVDIAALDRRSLFARSLIFFCIKKPGTILNYFRFLKGKFDNIITVLYFLVTYTLFVLLGSLLCKFDNIITVLYFLVTYTLFVLLGSLLCLENYHYCNESQILRFEICTETD